VKRLNDVAGWRAVYLMLRGRSMKIALGVLGVVLGCTMLVGCGEGLGHHGQYAKTPENAGTTELTSASVQAPAAKNAAPARSDVAYESGPSASGERHPHLLDRNDPYAAGASPVDAKRWMADRNDPWTGEAVNTKRAKVDRNALDSK
jgi:hypothetical protein